MELMRNINSTLLQQARTSIFIAHRLRTVVEAGAHFSLALMRHSSLQTHRYYIRD
jgi:ABC transporter ATM